MSDDLRVSFPIDDLNRFIVRVTNVTKKLDDIESKAPKIQKAVETLFKQSSETSKKLRDNVIKLAGAFEGVSDKSYTADFATDAFFTNLITASRTAELSLQALTSRQSESFKIMSQTANNEKLIQFLKNVTTEQTRLNLAYKQSERDLKNAKNETQQLTEVNKVAAKGITARAVAEEKLKQNLLNARQELKLFSTAEAERLRAIQRTQKDLEAAEALDHKRATTLKKVREEMRFLNSEEGKAITAAQNKLKVLKDSQAVESQRVASLRKQKEELAYLNTEDGKRSVIISQQLKDQRSAVAEDTKRVAALEALKRELDYVNSAEGKRAAELKAAISSTKNLKSEETVRAENLKKLRGELAHLNTAEGKQTAILREELKAKRDLISEEVRRNRVLEQSRRELEYLRSEQGRQLQLVKQQIAEENRLSAARAKNLGILNQANAAFRASLTGLKASIGMYTSSTILIATAMYGVSRAIRTGVTSGAEFSAQMARSNAILGTSAGMMEVVEGRVRALGKTTQFTSSEASGALIELGMAGITAGDSILALKPVLDLATIGNMSLADSAKLSTDILLMFNKEASELSNVVDIMAVAATNSNATVAELTNSISYAGPAAATLGMEIEDVTASVEMLANAGIRGSRAGTALRRMFLNLAKPTAAGQAVMDKYGISVTDFNGKTRDLTSILEILQTQLSHLSDEEQLKALTELFGVRAASGVNILVKGAQDVRILREQLSLTGDAAADMQEKIRDSLDFDLKELTSTFQELQLSVFKDHEMSLRIWVQELRGFINYMGESADGVNTRLESMVYSIGKFGQALAYIVAANYTAKLLVGVHGLMAGTSKLSITSSGLSTSFAALNAQATSLSFRLSAVSTGSRAAMTSMSILAAGTWAASTAMAALRVAIYALPVVGWVLGIGSAAYGVYEIVKSLYSDDVTRDIETQTAALERQRKEYQKIKDANKFQDAITSNESNKAAHEESLKYLEEQKHFLEELKKRKEEYQDTGVSTGLVNKQIEVQTAKIEKLVTTVKSLDEAAKNSSRQLDAELLKQGKKADLIEKIARLQEEADKREAAHAKLENSGSGLNFAARSLGMGMSLKLRDEAVQALKLAQEELKELTKGIDELSSTAKEDPFDMLYDPLVKYLEKLKEIRAELQETFIEGSKTDFGKMITLERDVAALRASGEEAVTEFNRLKEEYTKTGGDLTSEQKRYLNVLLSQSESSFKAALELEGDLFKARKTNEEHLSTLRDAQAAQQEGEASRLNTLNSLKIGSLDTLQRESKLLADKVTLKEKVASLESARNFQEAAKVQGDLNKVEGELNKILSDRVSTYMSLSKVLDPVRVANAEFNSTQERMAALLRDGHRSQDDYTRAMNVAWETKQKVIDANNKELQSLLKLRQAYGNMKTDTYLRDLLAIRKLKESSDFDPRELAQLEDNLKSKEIDSYGFKPSEMTRSMSRGAGMDPSVTALMDIEKGRADFFLHEEDVQRRHAERLVVIEEEYYANRQSVMEKEFAIESERTQSLVDLNQERYDMMIEANDAKNEALKKSDDAYREYSRMSNQVMLAQTLGFASNMADQIAGLEEEGSKKQKRMFAISKLLAAAQIIVNAHLAASQVAAEPGTNAISASIQKAVILAQGYSSAAVVTAMGVQAYDDGGHIPKGSVGIVGEKGMELVHGPANVTSRKDTQKLLEEAAEGGRGGAGSSIKIVNAFDTKVIGNYLSTSDGERLLLNTVKRNKQTIREYLG